MFLTMVSMIMILTIVSMIKFVTLVTMRMAVLCLCHESVLWMGNSFSECRRNAPRHQLMTRGLATWSYHDNHWRGRISFAIFYIKSINERSSGDANTYIPVLLCPLSCSINLFWIKGMNIEYKQSCQNLWSIFNYISLRVWILCPPIFPPRILLVIWP